MTSHDDTWSCMRYFFQAEDGIRDLTVTGVQTCALPILPRQRRIDISRHNCVMSRQLINFASRRNVEQHAAGDNRRNRHSVALEHAKVTAPIDRKSVV